MMMIASGVEVVGPSHAPSTMITTRPPSCAHHSRHTPKEHCVSQCRLTAEAATAIFMQGLPPILGSQSSYSSFSEPAPLFLPFPSSSWKRELIMVISPVQRCLFWKSILNIIWGGGTCLGSNKCGIAVEFSFQT